MPATYTPTRRQCSQRIRACPSQLPPARGLVTAHLRLWGHAELADSAALIVTELAANAIQHTHGAGDFFELAISEDASGVVLEVTDGCGCVLPEPRAPEPGDTAGRGLMIVAALATEWGVRMHGAGKTVWASLSATGSKAAA